MKPIVVAQLAGSAAYGGGERYLESLYDRLDRRMYRFVLICPEDGPFVGRMRDRGAHVHVVTLAPLFNPFALWRLVTVLRDERVTLLQTHGARSNFYGRIAGWLAVVGRVVSTVHNSIKDYEVHRGRRWLYATALRLTVPLADRIICVSDATRRDLLEECPVAADRTCTVYNGVDLGSFSFPSQGTTVRAEFANASGPVLLTVARLTEPKGHRFLLEALPGLVREWPALSCLFVGDGEDRESLQLLAKQLGVDQACRFVGGTDAVAEFYAAADIVVLPSISEGFPFVLLDALAMSRPVVATNVNGVPEIIEDGRTGLLVPPRDPQALEAAIRRLLLDPAAAAQMGRAGRAVVAERFTVEKMIEETVKAYKPSPLPASGSFVRMDAA